MGGFYKIRNRYSYDVDDNGAVIMLNNGNVAVLISDKTVNVKQFGAVGNGLTDDTTPIQNAMNYIATKKGGTVYFPEGNYKVTDTLTVNTSYVKIKGYNKSKAILRPTDDLLIGQEKLQANGFTTKKEIKPFNIANGWVIENNDIILKDSANVKKIYMFNINYSKSQCIDFSNGFVFRNNCVRDYKTGKSYQIKMCSNIKKIKLE